MMTMMMQKPRTFKGASSILITLRPTRASPPLPNRSSVLVLAENSDGDDDLVAMIMVMMMNKNNCNLVLKSIAILCLESKLMKVMAMRITDITTITIGMIDNCGHKEVSRDENVVKMIFFFCQVTVRRTPVYRSRLRRSLVDSLSPPFSPPCTCSCLRFSLLIHVPSLNIFFNVTLLLPLS